MILAKLQPIKKIRYFINWKKRFIFSHDPRAILMIGLTYSCQCNCEHCGMALYKKKGEKELSTQEVLEIINGLSKRKIRAVYFFGGEPLLRKDILELINGASQRKFVTILDTNGYLLNQEMAKNLKKAGLKVIEVSIDSPHPEVHNLLRKKEGIFEKAVQGIKNCKEQRIKCYLSTYATRENLKNGDLKKICSLGERLGVDQVRILPPILTGEWLSSEERGLDHQERKIFKSFSQPGFIFLEDSRCAAMSKRDIYISPYGDVQPCCFIPLSFGNIREEPLEKILKRMWRHPLFRMKIEGCPMNDEEFRKKYISKIKSSDKLPIKLPKKINAPQN